MRVAQVRVEMASKAQKSQKEAVSRAVEAAEHAVVMRMTEM